MEAFLLLLQDFNIQCVIGNGVAVVGSGGSILKNFDHQKMIFAHPVAERLHLGTNHALYLPCPLSAPIV
jgi:hypothetical protein